MNIVESNNKGLLSQKVVADVSQLISPVVDETNVAVGFGGKINLAKGVDLDSGSEMGTKGIKVYLDGPYESFSTEFSLNYSGRADGHINIAGRTVLGNKPEEGMIS